jgi:RNase P subunit RPR2
MKFKQKLKKRNEQVEIAKERVEILKKMIEKEPDFKERYRELIKRISDKYKLEKSF